MISRDETQATTAHRMTALILDQVQAFGIHCKLPGREILDRVALAVEECDELDEEASSELD